jgi:ferrochelatase
MRLENFLALTHTTLINEPCVNGFENIVFEASKVKRGDLFFAFEHDEIDEALQNGAYGIVFEKDAAVKDAEIAWINSTSLNNTLKKLLRFKVIEKELVAYECNEIILKLALQLITQSNFLVINSDMKSLYRSIKEIEPRTTLLFCPQMIDSDIFVNTKQTPNSVTKSIDVMEQTLFETSFIYDNVFYERQLISPFFIPYLEILLHLMTTLKINFSLKKFVPIDHFEPVFTNKNFEIKNFGASDKVLIFESDASLIESEMEFLQSRASWANIIFILPSSSTCRDEKNVFRYENEDEIIEILKAQSFNFALIVGVDKSILERPILNTEQLTLKF